MVTKLKNNSEYIIYIRNNMKKELPNWMEVGACYEKQINDNFQIDFENFDNKLSFVKDRGLLEIRIYKGDDTIGFGYLIYNSILFFIPEQDRKWRTTICTELIDYYINFLKL
jgi:hypothetical protein